MSVRYRMRYKPPTADEIFDPNINTVPRDLFAETIAQRLCACPFCSARWWADVATETVHKCHRTGRTDRFMVPA